MDANYQENDFARTKIKTEFAVKIEFWDGSTLLVAGRLTII